MNSEQALQEVLQTFFEVETAGPIYRGDNQDILNGLGPVRRKQFQATRHRLAKAALKGRLEKENISESFRPVLFH